MKFVESVEAVEAVKVVEVVEVVEVMGFVKVVALKLAEVTKLTKSVIMKLIKIKMKITILFKAITLQFLLNIILHEKERNNNKKTINTSKATNKRASTEDTALSKIN